MPTPALWDTGKWDDSVWDNIAAWTGIIRSDLSMLERDMKMEKKEIGMSFEGLERKMKIESLERKMMIEVVPE